MSAPALDVIRAERATCARRLELLDAAVVALAALEPDADKGREVTAYLMPAPQPDPPAKATSPKRRMSKKKTSPPDTTADDTKPLSPKSHTRFIKSRAHMEDNGGSALDAHRAVAEEEGCSVGSVEQSYYQVLKRGKAVYSSFVEAGDEDPMQAIADWWGIPREDAETLLDGGQR